jgi:hypothetical protein
MTRRYEPCQKVVEMYPAWKLCEKPVPAQQRPQRCPEHAAKLPIWPTEAK